MIPSDEQVDLAIAAFDETWRKRPDITVKNFSGARRDAMRSALGSLLKGKDMTELVKRLEAAAEAACHEEQMTVWSGEVVGSLSLGGFLREDLSYDDSLDLHAEIAREIKRIVTSAFGHPEAISALRAQEGMGWRPIETAPKDGTDILTFPHYRIVDWNVRGWQCGWQDDDCTIPDYCRPTHWVSLPPAPIASSTETEERE